MANQAGFQSLAARLIGSTFADFASEATITRSTGYDYTNQVDATESQTINMIRLMYDDGRIDGELIKKGDVKLIGQYQLLSWLPSPDDTTVTYDNCVYDVMAVTVDPASATVEIQGRLK